MFGKHKTTFTIFFFALLVLDFFVFREILLAERGKDDLKLYFLDVGQGDSELAILPGGAKILIDGGPPNGKVLENLARILPPNERYIDLVMVSHAQLDHFGGLIEVLRRYRVGAFLWNGRDGNSKAWAEFKKILEEYSVRGIVLTAPDKIHYGESQFEILAPLPKFLKSEELNDTAIVAKLSSKNSEILFTGDIGFGVEKALPASDVDILKVAHHGSKYSSGAEFLSAVKPEIAVIEVGKNNYGHPTEETLSRLENAGAKTYRTDRDGTIKFLINGQTIKIFK
ncbi:MAG: ComEC/Rec2 family competence protein [Patescibacteria group bacterium]